MMAICFIVVHFVNVTMQLITSPVKIRHTTIALYLGPRTFFSRERAGNGSNTVKSC